MGWVAVWRVVRGVFGERPAPPATAPSPGRACAPRLRAIGLPPVDEEPSHHFALLAEIAARNGLTRLSMGMSGDYAVAVTFGATHVRVGTAIFGRRPPA